MPHSQPSGIVSSNRTVGAGGGTAGGVSSNCTVGAGGGTAGGAARAFDFAAACRAASLMATCMAGGTSPRLLILLPPAKRSTKWRVDSFSTLYSDKVRPSSSCLP
eukprot:CAMPEP_0114684790 /NCGR_PEP_ID=MMETSP0191-20121206/59573_1 /TAXON_ID=126664 /ORGANISM="Sorites sp." /LENGTH=104 /DNA_ID=CAMNT_0001968111 /DNA_START=238 /DNA_END=548 /DNA_ORIENTATION=+